MVPRPSLRGWQLIRCRFVGDAGMVSQANWQTLYSGGGNYLLAMPMRRGDEVTEDVLSRPGRYRSVADSLHISILTTQFPQFLRKLRIYNPGDLWERLHLGKLSILSMTTTESTKPAGTVYLVDDDPAILRMLQALVASIGVGTQPFSSAREFLAAYRPMPCACLVCDVRMPDVDGLELQRQLMAGNAALPIIFITGFAEVSMAVEAMKRGAFDFIEKPFSAQQLLGKIQLALDRSRIQYSEWSGQQAIEARLALLTPRERSVIAYVREGKSSREAAELLGISSRTVENHRTRIMQKLHVESTVELVNLFR